MATIIDLFYPRVHVNALSGEKYEALKKRVSELNVPDQDFLFDHGPGSPRYSSNDEEMSINPIQRIRYDNASVEQLLLAESMLHDYDGKGPINGFMSACNISPAYSQVELDVGDYFTKRNETLSDSHHNAMAVADTVARRVQEIANELVLNSGIALAKPPAETVQPLRIIVATDPLIGRYLDLGMECSMLNNIVDIATSLHLRMRGKIIISVARAPTSPGLPDLNTFGVLNYADTTREVRQNKPTRYQMHYEFINQIPILGVINVKNIKHP